MQTTNIYHVNQCNLIFQFNFYLQNHFHAHLTTSQLELDRVQKFGLRMSCRNWRSDYESLLTRVDLSSLKMRRSIAKLCFHRFLCQSPGLWTPDLAVFVIPCSSSRLQELTLTNFLFILPQLPYRIIYFPGCTTVLIYLHLRLICVAFSARVFLRYNFPCIIICCFPLLWLPRN